MILTRIKDSQLLVIGGNFSVDADDLHLAAFLCQPLSEGIT
jgi:hypothetical protein